MYKIIIIGSQMCIDQGLTRVIWRRKQYKSIIKNKESFLELLP